MVKFINAATGGAMFVHEDRVQEYLAAGHRLAASAPDPADDGARDRKTPAAKTDRKKTAKSK